MATDTLGGWAFLIGVILAVVFGFASFPALGVILVILGVIVGLLNIADKEVKNFLYAGTILVIVSSLGGNVFNSVHNSLGAILSNMLTLFVPATIIVALKSVFSMAKSK